MYVSILSRKNKEKALVMKPFLTASILFNGVRFTLRAFESQLHEAENWEYAQKKVAYKDNLIDKFASQRPRTPMNKTNAVSNVKNSQLSAEPMAYHTQLLFELPPQGRQPQHSGACAGCGETPYLKCITQLFGEQMIVIKRFF